MFYTFTRPEKFINLPEWRMCRYVFESECKDRVSLGSFGSIIFSFTKRPFLWTILNHFLSFLFVLRFCHKSRLSSCGTTLLQYFFETDGIRNSIQWWSSLTVLFCSGFETMNESVNMGITDVNWRLPLK